MYQLYVVQNFELQRHASAGSDRCYISHVSHDDHDDNYDDHDGAHHPQSTSLHRGRDHIVVVDHRMRIDKLIARRLHFGLGGLGLL